MSDQHLSDYETAELERSCKSKELKGVLLRTRRLIVHDEYSDTPIGPGREGKRSGQDTDLRDDARLGLQVHVDNWMSTDGETHLQLRDGPFLQDLISILASLCLALEHISLDLHWIRPDRYTSMPMPMISVITICIKSLYCTETLRETLLAVSKSFPNAESLDLQVVNLHLYNKAYTPQFNSSSSLREFKLRYEVRPSDDIPAASLFMDISTSYPNIVSLVISGIGRLPSDNSGKDISLCKLPHLTNIHLEPFGMDDCCRFDTFLNVLHIIHMTSPSLKLVEAKKVQLGDAELASVKWSRTYSSCELQLEGASAAVPVPMADLIHLVSNEVEEVTVLTFDKCKVDILQSISHPPQSTRKENSLQELKFLNVECPWSQTDIDKLSEMYPNVKVTVAHDSKASHENSKQGTSMPFKLKRKTSPSSPTSLIDEVNVVPIKMECCKRVGVQGGKLQLDSFGIELEIPPSAIDSEAPQDISLRVLTDTPNLGNSKEEMSVCFGVQCLAPDDLVLKLPVTYTIPHCAVITRYSSVKAVLYTGEGEYSPDAVVKERIMLSRSGTPSCIITKDVLKLKMNHFSWAKIKLMIKNFFFKGKKMRCRPFKENNLALQKTPVILRAHLYDAIKGNCELIKRQEEEQEFVPAHPEQEIVIQAAESNLKMTCYVKETVIGRPAVVPFDKLMSGARICKPFELDFTDQPDIVAVSLRIGQNEKLEDELLFPLDFSIPYRRKRNSPQDPEQVLQGASSSKKQRTSRGSTGETQENRSGKQDDFDKKLTTVARKVATRVDIDNFMTALGLQPGDIQHYVNDNKDSSYMVTLSMLRDWRKKQTKATECGALKDVLQEAGQTYLADELFGTS